MAMAVTGVEDWPAVRLPAIRSPLNTSKPVLALRASTKVPPRVMKSPTCTVARPPMRLVELETLAGCGVTPVAGSLMREAMMVAWYLSAAKSICSPLKRGLENVMGVRVVRISLPTVIA